MANVIKLSKVSFAYERSYILDGIDLTVVAGEFIAIVGPNGGGKTTLLKLLLGLLEPTHGEIRIFNLPPRKARRFIGYVPQQGTVDRDFPVSALEVVLMGRLAPNSFFPRYQRADYQAAAAAMQAVGVGELADVRFSDLSGGQKQRTLIARALVGEPQLLILDEPTASVDPQVEQDIYELLAQLNKDVTIVLVSHDLGYVTTHLRKVAYLNRNLVVYPPGGNVSGNIPHWYTVNNGFGRGV